MGWFFWGEFFLNANGSLFRAIIVKILGLAYSAFVWQNYIEAACIVESMRLMFQFTPFY